MHVCRIGVSGKLCIALRRSQQIGVSNFARELQDLVSSEHEDDLPGSFCVEL